MVDPGRSLHTKIQDIKPNVTNHAPSISSQPGETERGGKRFSDVAAGSRVTCTAGEAPSSLVWGTTPLVVWATEVVPSLGEESLTKWNLMR